MLIYDDVRKKYVLLTPEEWVRQHFIFYMLHELKYPRSLMRVESGLVYNRLKKRSDIIVYNRAGLPWMLVECKSPEITINQKTLDQAAVYNTTVKAAYIALTNGLKHICCEVDHAERKLTTLSAFPQL